MYEIWKISDNDNCIYSEDPKLCRHLSRLKWATWFGTYHHGRWLAEQYRFEDRHMPLVVEMAERGQ